MTELETMQRAKQYIDNLAKGTDPISGAELPEDTVLNNVRLARCFYYISGVLEKVIANGGEISGMPKKEKKQPFSITRQEIDAVPVQETPTYISHFCQAISAAARVEETNRKALSYRVVNDWLCEKGFLEIVEYRGKKQKRVTELGRQIGMAEVERDGREGRYVGVTYNEEAQQFILDNLELILSGEM